jgi:hypothetical protein
MINLLINIKARHLYLKRKKTNMFSEEMEGLIKQSKAFIIKIEIIQLKAYLISLAAAIKKRIRKSKML